MWGGGGQTNAMLPNPGRYQDWPAAVKPVTWESSDIYVFLLLPFACLRVRRQALANALRTEENLPGALKQTVKC